MSTNNNTSSTSPTRKSQRNVWDPKKESAKQNFRVQEKPPLSLRQFLRSTVTVNPGGQQWKPSGVYNPPVVHDNPTPQKEPEEPPKVVKKDSKDKKPVWYPPGTVKRQELKAPNEENKSEKKENEKPEEKPRSRSKDKSIRPWRPSGNPEYDPVLYFDPPSLRWSAKQIKSTMPEFQSTSKKSSTNQK
ncbi:unnamed protein product [Adineta ricciae]|uniref:Uncharacterized protein n=1 Tax=Adineta ricciae TaxID=249248 RepID=A0A814XBW8_ADIRI|nr:unnamed protein product [Adineta ricciae]